MSKEITEKLLGFVMVLVVLGIGYGLTYLMDKKLKYEEMKPYCRLDTVIGIQKSTGLTALKNQPIECSDFESK